MEKISKVTDGESPGTKKVEFENTGWHVIIEEYNSAEGGMVVAGRTLLNESDFEKIEKEVGYPID